MDLERCVLHFKTNFCLCPWVDFWKTNADKFAAPRRTMRIFLSSDVKKIYIAAKDGTNPLGQTTNSLGRKDPDLNKCCARQQLIPSKTSKWKKGYLRGTFTKSWFPLKGKLFPPDLRIVRQLCCDEMVRIPITECAKPSHFVSTTVCHGAAYFLTQKNDMAVWRVKEKCINAGFNWNWKGRMMHYFESHAFALKKKHHVKLLVLAQPTQWG